ncbi:GMC family oxidoreductase [Phanerochaete sordida]|uniref:GMC family oxidoreductase n=1 Tax=Phanerochaete sordida TaxID=48140 RepID=A0A9P3GB34_9APHY|nr:GMC family oxidoreductase [Phanerochaete sordida]
MTSRTSRSTTLSSVNRTMTPSSVFELTVTLGGGTAGLTIAARLTEDSATTVCVLEAGDANLNDPAILTPATYMQHFGDKLYDWNHFTTKQKFSGDREMHWARGRGLGGSSAINFMVWTKPPAEEIDDIERLGNPGWNWQNYQKYAQKVERLIEPTPQQKEKFNLPEYENDVSRDGAVAIGFPKTISEADVLAQKALENAGIPKAPRPYGGNPNGTFWTMNTHDPRTPSRSYATTAYYLPNKDRPNMVVFVRALVSRVLTEVGADGNLSAVGAEFIHDEKIYSVNAIKEVILAAGAIKSPQVLELSGIGQRAVLENAGIPVKLDLPTVGENLQEHCIGGFSFELKDGVDLETADPLRQPSKLAEAQELYKRGEGPFTIGMPTFTFVPVEQIAPQPQAIYEKAKAQVERVVKEGAAPGLLEQWKIQLERLEPGKNQAGPGCEIIFFSGMFGPIPPEEGKKYVCWSPGTNHNFSRGSIHVTSSDPRKEPDIDAHYFEHQVDLDIFIETSKFARKMAQMPPLKDLIAKEVVPGPEVKTDEQLADFMTKVYSTTWHTCGTCSMLPQDKGGVVDPSLKVYGTNNLRIVDLSILPLHFAGHTQATVYTFAEQAADIIKGVFKP